MLLFATKIRSAEPLYPHRGSHTNHDSVMGPKGIDNRNAAFFISKENGVWRQIWMDAIVFYF